MFQRRILVPALCVCSLHIRGMYLEKGELKLPKLRPELANLP